MQDETHQSRAGFVALIGEPNAGKSTLLNRMVGAKVSIVTHKVQTTRARIRGVAIEGESQIVFVDTPGLFRPRRRLDRAMVAAAWSGAADADVVVVMVEAHRGVDAEVIDVATVSPLDMDTILDSVARTGRCVIVHEAARSCGVGAEIAACLAGEGITSLLAPVKRVTGYDTVMPLYRHEEQYMPGVDRIIDAVRECMEYR